MKIGHFGSVLLVLAGCSAAPAAAADVSAELGVVSDYRYRGISLSDGHPAVQASLTLDHQSGVYASVWSTTISEPGFDADVELDLAGGYALELGDGLNLDLSATYYVYPSEPAANYVEATAIVERACGPAVLRAGFSFVPRQRGTRDEHGQKKRNSYLLAGVSYTLPKFPITLTAELGREEGIFDEAVRGGKLDWRLDATITFNRFRMGLAYTGTDVGSDALVASLFTEL